MFREMPLTPLTALSPLDGRYHEKVAELRPFLSEYAFIKYRVFVEISWLKKITSLGIDGIPRLDKETEAKLDGLIENFSLADAERVKQHEETTKHDVKAIEYFIKDHLSNHDRLLEFVHFGCTSEDVNNLAYALMMKGVHENCIIPALCRLVICLGEYAHQYADVPMLGHTHGQPATPTTMGKEFANTVMRLQKQCKALSKIHLRGKWNGAVGNYNSFTFALPDIDWENVSKEFVESVGVKWSAYTTQIEPHDHLVCYLATLHHISSILIGLDRDMWTYISMQYLKLKLQEGEVGSSTMPHKINPIDFENAEGNFGMAGALFSFMGEKLPISRMQRDLSDSTVLRNLGVALGYFLIGCESTLKGLRKVDVDENKLQFDLNNNWAVLAEPIQTVMRLYGIEKPYEKLKFFTQGKEVKEETMHDFIVSLNLPKEVKERLLALTPGTYTGYAEQLARRI